MAEKTAKNIYQRMAAITDEIATVAKNKTVLTGNGDSYKAVTERDVLDAVKPVEGKYGVFSYPFSREIISSDWMEKESKYGKKLSNFIRVQTVYRFVNVDAPNEFVDVISWGDGIDSGDKATGKAMTYSDKYALMKAYKISTGDDPDQEASGTYSPAPKREPKRAPARPLPPEPAPRSTEPTAGDKLLGSVKATHEDLQNLYKLACKVSQVNAETVNDAIKSAYHCTPEDITVEQLLEFRGKLEARQARQEAEKAAKAAGVTE